MTLLQTLVLFFVKNVRSENLRHEKDLLSKMQMSLLNKRFKKENTIVSIAKTAF